MRGQQTWSRCCVTGGGGLPGTARTVEAPLGGELAWGAGASRSQPACSCAGGNWAGASPPRPRRRSRVLAAEAAWPAAASLECQRRRALDSRLTPRRSCGTPHTLPMRAERRMPPSSARPQTVPLNRRLGRLAAVCPQIWGGPAGPVMAEGRGMALGAGGLEARVDGMIRTRPFPTLPRLCRHRASRPPSSLRRHPPIVQVGWSEPVVKSPRPPVHCRGQGLARMIGLC